MSSERIFVTGTISRIGTYLLQSLIKNGVHVTVYARSPVKITQVLNVVVVQGTYQDLTPLESAIAGHIRLFLTVINVPDSAKLKLACAATAYDTGVKQIVDVSAVRVP